MRLAIFGIGSMGCLFGARLSPHADVTLIGHWPEQLNALQRTPLRVIHTDGRESIVKLGTTGDLSSIEPVDAALTLTKSGKTKEAASGAVRILKPDGLAITLQNGIGNLEIIASEIGEGRAALGTTTQGASIIEPGVLKEGGAGLTHLATRPEIDPVIRELAALFRKGGLTTEVVDDVSGLVWGKLAVNAAINPLTALLRIPNGALLESEHTRSIMALAAREVAAVAAAQGIALPYPDPATRAEEVARLTGVNRSSMLQDALRGAETEIEAICGAVVREGERLGVPTPTNAFLHKMVKSMEHTHSRRL